MAATSYLPIRLAFHCIGSPSGILGPLWFLDRSIARANANSRKWASVYLPPDLSIYRAPVKKTVRLVEVADVGFLEETMYLVTDPGTGLSVADEGVVRLELAHEGGREE